MRVLHIIVDLQTGGAESMLAKLLQAFSRANSEHFVVTLRPGEERIRREIEALGVTVYSLNLVSLSGVVKCFSQLQAVIREAKPNLLQGWMYHGNLVAWLAGIFNRLPVVWNIRYTLGSLRCEKCATRAVIVFGRLLSARPAWTIYNSNVSRNVHRDFGYAIERSSVIPNGFDFSRFRPDPQMRSESRSKLGISSETLVVGIAARYHAMKDYPTFLSAAAIVARERKRVHFVLCGKGIDRENPELLRTLEKYPELGSRVSLLGEVRDLTEFYPMLDVFVLSSAWGEGFPNVLGEAMASGVPCVATNTGDSAEVVGDNGVVVGPCDAPAIARGVASILELSDEEREQLQRECRVWVEQRFSIAEIAVKYRMLYERILEEHPSSDS